MEQCSINIPNDTLLQAITSLSKPSAVTQDFNYLQSLLGQSGTESPRGSESLNKRSRRIRKDSSHDYDYKDKVQDKGDYYIIHRLNQCTKRMNQILQCKKCPLKFPKLCNLRDHLRIHNSEMPFTCGLCGKKFTQAGNRDRHEKKQVCLKQDELEN
jgi:hypothetical protein